MQLTVLDTTESTVSTTKSTVSAAQSTVSTTKSNQSCFFRTMICDASSLRLVFEGFTWSFFGTIIIMWWQLSDLFSKVSKQKKRRRAGSLQ